MRNLAFNDEFLNQNNLRILASIDIQPRYQAVVSGFKIRQSSSKAAAETSTTNELKPDNRFKDILLDIYNRFDIASFQRARDMGLSASASNSIYRYLEREQLTESFTLNLSGKKGGLSKYHVLTKKGLEVVDKSAIKQSGGTGSKHHFIQRYLKKHLPSLGFKDLVIEKNIAGKRIDLFGIYNEMKIGIEICISTINKEHVNVQKDIDKCDLLIIVCPDKNTKTQLEKEIYKNTSPDIDFKICLISELLNNPDELIDANRNLFK